MVQSEASENVVLHHCDMPTQHQWHDLEEESELHRWERGRLGTALVVKQAVVLLQKKAA